MFSHLFAITNKSKGSCAFSRDLSCQNAGYLIFSNNDTTTRNNQSLSPLQGLSVTVPYAEAGEKIYFELLSINDGSGHLVGIINELHDGTTPIGSNLQQVNQWGLKPGLVGDGWHDGTKLNNYAVPGWFEGDVIMIAIDCSSLAIDQGKLYYGANGVWFTNSNPVTGDFPFASDVKGSRIYGAYSHVITGISMTCRLHADEWTYSPPATYSAFACSKVT